MRTQQASQGYYLDMANQVAVELGTFPHIKAERGNPVGGTGSQNQAKEPEITPVPTVVVP